MTLPFLEQLGLDQTADATTIRRAYARQLKQVDQEADPDGFAALRTAYEQALAWSEQPNAAAEPVPNAADPIRGQRHNSDPQPPTPPDRPLVTQAHARFAEALQQWPNVELTEALRTISTDLHHQAPDQHYVFQWQLLAAVAQENAPHRFEIFLAADQVFHLASQSTHAPAPDLRHWLDALLVQREAWITQPVGTRERQLNLLQTVQTGTFNRDNAGEIGQMLNRFPTFSSLVADRDARERWKQAAEESGGIPDAPAPQAFSQAQPPGKRRVNPETSANFRVILRLLIFLGIGISSAYRASMDNHGHGSSPEPSSQTTAQAGVLPTYQASANKTGAPDSFKTQVAACERKLGIDDRLLRGNDERTATARLAVARCVEAH
ncbi:hypothetical protein [Pinirhizobacter soli]|uniref:hypothetical protein n=1 Tax=Pinirhizobacter soli TaxID=2786953 RepID=UPI002029D09C|nr:hypothetical protein [Pinirhizobacter soli]